MFSIHGILWNLVTVKTFPSTTEALTGFCLSESVDMFQILLPFGSKVHAFQNQFVLVILLKDGPRKTLINGLHG